MSKLLFIGGTRFVGRAMAEAFIDAGHDCTLFHRGQSGPDLFPAATHILGDREADLSGLAGKSWDAVIDVSGYKPSVVRKSCEALKGSVGRYVFVSTISVYSDEGTGAITEVSPLHVMPKGREDDETVDPETYGALKVLCENEVTKAFGEQSLMFRPGLVMGPHDVTDRFTYWVRAGALASHLAIPTYPEQPVQITDARDLAEFMFKLVQDGINGKVNVVGPTEPLTFGVMWQVIQEALGREVITEWNAKDAPGPMPSAPGFERFMQADCSYAKSLGFKTRALADTVRDTWGWDEERGLPELTSAPARFRKAD